MRTPSQLFDFCMAIVFENEGGYVSSAEAARIADHGGETNYGVTEVTLRRIGLRQLASIGVMSLDPEALTKSKARQIYREFYFRKVNQYQETDQGLTLMMFDAQVQHGLGVQLLQRTVGVWRDGIVGPKTERAVSLYCPKLLLIDYAAHRRRLTLRWAERDERRTQLIVGLVKRIDSVLRSSILAREPVRQNVISTGR